MTITQMQERICAACKDSIDPAFVSAGLLPIDDYMIREPDNEERRQVGICPGESTDSEDQESYEFIIMIQLPEVRDAGPYQSALWPVVKKHLTPSLIGMIRREIQAVSFNPGEDPSHLGSAFIYIGITFSRDLDDSQFDDEDDWEE